MNIKNSSEKYNIIDSAKSENEKKRDRVSRGNDTVLSPKKTLEPQYLTYIAVDNKTTETGGVINKADIDAEICRKETDANKL